MIEVWEHVFRCLLIMLAGFVFGLAGSMLYRKLRLWWETGRTSVPQVLDYYAPMQGKHALKSSRPIGVSGLHIVVEAGEGRELVSAGQAQDRGEFWRCWRALGGQADGWVDEDGAPFDPTG